MIINEARFSKRIEDLYERFIKHNDIKDLPEFKFQLVLAS